MDKQTPLPWKVVHNDFKNEDVIVGADGLTAALPAQMNAEFIVRAVNAHESTLTAMYDALANIKDALNVSSKIAPSLGIPLVNAQVKLEQAIAKAEGK